MELRQDRPRGQLKLDSNLSICSSNNSLIVVVVIAVVVIAVVVVAVGGGGGAVVQQNHLFSEAFAFPTNEK